MKIGPSTGWLYAIEISDMNEHKKIIDTAGMNLFEICCYQWGDERIDAILNSKNLTGYTYKSIHLPNMKQISDLDELYKMKKIVNDHKIKTCVIHRDGFLNQGKYLNQIITELNKPITIENLDGSRDNKREIEDLQILKNDYEVSFMLDVQHAYEHDHSMNYAKELYSFMEDKLTHLHVSGETENNIHSLVHKSRNAKEIIDFLGYIFSKKKVPIVLEGEYKTAQELKKEREFLEKELGK
jgi:hypothetical protein